jgi:hypothetical protein
MRCGDLIYILPGTRTPFVLRDTRKGKDLLGDCFVQGIMDGEAINKTVFATDVLPHMAALRNQLQQADNILQTKLTNQLLHQEIAELKDAQRNMARIGYRLADEFLLSTYNTWAPTSTKCIIIISIV